MSQHSIRLHNLRMRARACRAPFEVSRLICIGTKMPFKWMLSVCVCVLFCDIMSETKHILFRDFSSVNGKIKGDKIITSILSIFVRQWMALDSFSWKLSQFSWTQRTKSQAHLFISSKRSPKMINHIKMILEQRKNERLCAFHQGPFLILQCFVDWIARFDRQFHIFLTDTVK